MSRAIFKYEVPLNDQWNSLRMPFPARVVHVDSQHPDVVCVWAEVDPDCPDELTRNFAVFGTGHAIPDGASYVGTAPAGPFVWHVYAKAAK